MKFSYQPDHYMEEVFRADLLEIDSNMSPLGY